MKEHDPVNSPSHYTSSSVEVLDAIEAWGLNYRLGNVVKYVARCGKKAGEDPIECLQKSLFYLMREISARHMERADEAMAMRSVAPVDPSAMSGGTDSAPPWIATMERKRPKR